MSCPKALLVCGDVWIFFLFPGPDRGVCRCRKCQCKPKYHGANCDKKNCTYFPPETQCKKDTDSVRQLFCRDPFTDCFLSYIIIKKGQLLTSVVLCLFRRSVEVLREANASQMTKTATSVFVRVLMMEPTVKSVR